MCPRCRLSYKWLKGLPTDGKQYYRDVQRRPKSTNAYNKRPYPASDRQRPPVVEPMVNRLHDKGKKLLHESRPHNYYRVESSHSERKLERGSVHGIRAREWPPRPVLHRTENGHPYRRSESDSKHEDKTRHLPSRPVSKMASKVEKGSSASESASSWVPGVPDWLVMQIKPRE